MSALRGSVSVPGDKSISHRALLLGAIAGGASHVRGFLPSGDCRATLGCLRALGIPVEVHDATTLTVHGQGLRGLRPPTAALDCARSGTTMRLLAGILAGQVFTTTLTGDSQLLRRPMERIARPLRRMGAKIATTEGHAPLVIRGGRMQGGEHTLPVASAQVKSAVLLAGLYAAGPTTVHQPGPARDHTERMLEAMGAHVAIDELSVTVEPPTSLAPLDLQIPGDISSAAFLLVAATLLPGSKLTVESVGVTPTRDGVLDVLEAMGARVAQVNRRSWGGEPVADLRVQSAPLTATTVAGDTVVRMIDEFPILAVAATQARGRTVVRDAAELRVKETDRVAVIAGELKKMGAHVTPRPDGFAIEGPTPLHGAAVDSHGDHRLAMALTVAGLVAEGETTVRGAECAADSFPGFEGKLGSILNS